MRAYSVLKNFLAGHESPNEREDQTNENVNIMKNNDNCSKSDFFVKEDKRAKKTGWRQIHETYANCPLNCSFWTLILYKLWWIVEQEQVLSNSVSIVLYLNLFQH